ncbi:MAG TPA: hypothetical protein LFW20_08045 [Rickettsia endosymbiont of Omalisus fontisbellaquei]|nr:hypothetical protein [Rickettsia endosymbiont of Omalisus fontisbellaquei]
MKEKVNELEDTTKIISEHVGDLSVRSKLNSTMIQQLKKEIDEITEDKEQSNNNTGNVFASEVEINNKEIEQIGQLLEYDD